MRPFVGEQAAGSGKLKLPLKWSAFYTTVWGLCGVQWKLQSFGSVVEEGNKYKVIKIVL